MYTVQALWTQARESFDVTTIIVSNRAYAILQIEMHRVQADPPGPDCGGPPRPRPARPRRGVPGPGLGVPAVSVSTVAELDAAFQRSLAEPGPFVIEAVLASRRPASVGCRPDFEWRCQCRDTHRHRDSTTWPP